MKTRATVVTIFICLFVLMASVTTPSAWAQTEQFYKGKTIRIVVGLSPGGDYDRAARLV